MSKGGTWERETVCGKSCSSFEKKDDDNDDNDDDNDLQVWFLF